MDFGCLVHFSHIEGIDVSILISSQEIERLHGIPSYAGAFIGQEGFYQLLVCSEIELINPSVDASAEANVVFCWI